MKQALKYLSALLWHWSVPALLGYTIAFISSTWIQIEVFKGFDAYFAEMLRPLVTSCVVPQ